MCSSFFFRASVFAACVFLLLHLFDVPPLYADTDVFPLPASKSTAPSLHHLVVATKSKPGLSLLLLSARRFGYATSVLGGGDSRPIGHHTTTLCLFDCPPSFGLKMTLVKEVVSALPPDDWVLFTDAYDVVFARPAEELVADLVAWESRAPHGAKILFGAEKLAWPDEGLPGYAARGSAPYPFLNSGVYAGRASAILEAVSDGYDISTNDQRFFTQKLVGTAAAPLQREDSRVELDETQSIFSNFAGTTMGADWEIAWPAHAPADPGHGSVVFTHAGSRARPAVLHFNSFGKVHMHRVAYAVLGAAASAIADLAQWDGNEVRELFLLPARAAILSPLPLRLRYPLADAQLCDVVAAAIALAAALLVVRYTGAWVARNCCCVCASARTCFSARCAQRGGRPRSVLFANSSGKPAAA